MFRKFSGDFFCTSAQVHFIYEFDFILKVVTTAKLYITHKLKQNRELGSYNNGVPCKKCTMLRSFSTKATSLIEIV